MVFGDIRFPSLEASSSPSLLLGVGVAGDHLQDVLDVLLAAEEDGAALVQLPGNQVQDRLPDNTMVLCQGV